MRHWFRKGDNIAACCGGFLSGILFPYDLLDWRGYVVGGVAGLTGGILYRLVVVLKGRREA